MSVICFSNISLLVSFRIRILLSVSLFRFNKDSFNEDIKLYLSNIQLLIIKSLYLYKYNSTKVLSLTDE